jgi:hypothetical protein
MVVVVASVSKTVVAVVAVLIKTVVGSCEFVIFLVVVKSMQ